ncbi:MAG TPA: RsmD family RNA methyltransferase [Candidatus Paceibacterota bacterium]|nr:RsmD family RNA methyltransferase [Candidatus Paceibacterota bacterium]
MIKREDITISNWDDYELLDSGEGRKLERFGTVVTDRPDPQVLWKKSDINVWASSTAQFVWVQKGERWKLDKDLRETWTFSYKNIKLELSCKGFKHVGVFPEHSHQWDEIMTLGLSAQAGAKNKGLKMLNLFGYTGAASIAGALAGMEVTHIDASKTTIATVKENISLSGLPADSIRTVCEDTLRYVKRLVQRGEKFDVIVMDPPKFGRGPKGEVWKIEESLSELLSFIPSILSEKPKLVILNGYAAEYSARTFAELLSQILPGGNISYGDIGIEQKNGNRILTTGIYAKWRI